MALSIAKDTESWQKTTDLGIAIISGKAIEADLDALQAEIRAQTAGLEKCLEQLDTYQQVRLMVLGVIVALRECQFH